MKNSVLVEEIEKKYVLANGQKISEDITVKSWLGFKQGERSFILQITDDKGCGATMLPETALELARTLSILAQKSISMRDRKNEKNILS